ncbi:MAG: PilZ domain-containing protein [Alphaproteobacteria bacterium]
MIRRHLAGYTHIERRRDRRHATQLSARIGDQPATIVDVSLGGLRMASVVARPSRAQSYRLGEEHRILLDIPSFGQLELRAIVARVDAAQQFIGLRFVELDLASYRVIERLAIGRPVRPQP